jgi:hypothetical protein
MSRRKYRTDLIIIPFILSLVSCSLNFDMPWDRNVADNPQKKTAKAETAPTQPESRPAPELSSVAGDEGRKWTKYMTDEEDIKHFCDEDAIVRPSKGIIQIWRKREFPPGATQKAIVTLDEIDCRKAECRTLELRVTYRDGTTGKSDKPTGWIKIYANSDEEYLMGEYCK